MPLFHISVKTPKLYCSRKLKSFLSNFFLHVPASVAHGILFSPVIEGPRERNGEYCFLNSNFISFSIRPVFPLTSLLMLKSCYPNLDPSSNSICKTFEDLLNHSVKWWESYLPDAISWLNELIHVRYLECARVLRCFSHVWLCDPMDRTLPVSSVHGILQARILEWFAMLSSRGYSQLRDQTHVICIPCISRWVLYRLGSLGLK